MSNEVNVTEILFGVLDPQVEVELYVWGDNNSYDKQRRRARFFSISPDPLIPLPGIGTIEMVPGQVDFQITRVWNTVWTAEDDSHIFQSNIAFANVGNSTSAFHLIQAETDN
jgi:hypothetical protein